MYSKNYPDYKIEKLTRFSQLVERMRSFGDYIAFKNGEEEISYARFLEDIDKVCLSFNDKRRFVLVNAKDKYAYVLGYFGAVLSGNIACLQPPALELMPCYRGFDFLATVDDNYIQNALKTDAKSIEYYENEDEICTVLCSSGTTSLPKAVVLTQKNVISDTVAGMEKYAFFDNGRFVNILPYSHAFGIVCDLLGPLYSCSTICFAYSTADFFAKLATFNPTALNVIPAIVGVLLKQLSIVPSKEMIIGNSLKKILSGGAGTPAELSLGMKKFGVEVYGCFGLSECAPCVSVNRDEYYKYGSAGVLLNCNELFIGDDGEISIKGTNVMSGYLSESGELIPLKDGIFHTGDMGYFDEDGFLYIVGRLDDMMVFSDGTKLMPTVVESEINKIQGVIESVVYKGEDKLLATVCVSDEGYIKSVKAAVLAIKIQDYRIFDAVVSTDGLEKNTLGKLNRKKYRE